MVNIQKVKRAYGPWNPSLPSHISKSDKSYLSQEVCHGSQTDLSHSRRNRAEKKESARGAETESRRELTGNPDMAKVITNVKVPNHA